LPKAGLAPGLLFSDERIRDEKPTHVAPRKFAGAAFPPWQTWSA